MKKALLIIVLFISFSGINAQESKNKDSMSYSQENREWRKKFINLSFTNAKMSQDHMQDLKSNYGVAFIVGRTFFLHKPIANMLRFGIDATWLDLNYTNYDIEHITYWETHKYQYHQGEISIHIGPSLTFEPIKKFTTHAYFQYSPTYAVLYTRDNNTIYGNYATLWIAGGNISYGVIGFGVESRFGSTPYKTMEHSANGDFKSNLSGFRAYLTFKF